MTGRSSVTGCSISTGCSLQRCGAQKRCANIGHVTGPGRTQVRNLQIDVRSEPDRIVLRLHGELDLASAPLLQSELEHAQAHDATLVVLDLDDLEFIDSTGLRIILAAHERSQQRGQTLALTRGSQQVQRLMSITRAGEHLRIIASPDEQLV